MSPPDERSGPREGGSQAEGHHTAATRQSTTTAAHGVPCRPRCGGACTLDVYTDYVLDDARPIPPATRLAFILLGGFPERTPPLPPHRYRDVLSVVEETYGVAEVVKGLRVASTFPSPFGSGVDTSAFAVMADGIAREAAS